MALAKAIFYLPIADNDGRELVYEHEETRWVVYDLFDAWTYIGQVEGIFRVADGSHAMDRSAAYVVIIVEERIPELEHLLRAFKARTKQEAIYLEIQHGVDFRLI
jgi:hypothetical protein